MSTFYGFAAHQAPLSMEFSRQVYWSGLPFPSPENLPDPLIEPGSPALQADFLPAELPGKPAQIYGMALAGRLEKEMATHSSVLAQRIPWTEEPGGLQSMGSQRVGYDFACVY